MPEPAHRPVPADAPGQGSSSGTPLPSAARSFFEPRFGADFGGVRVHTGSAAHEAARQLNARAFTTGHDIVFARGEYNVTSHEGRRLLAHELTHVVQQSSGLAAGVQRSCPKPPDCPDDFCEPFDSVEDAQDDREIWWEALRLGIETAVDSSVVPLWDTHVWGGDSPQDLSADFAADFEASEITAAVNADIETSIFAALRKSPPTFPETGNQVTVPVRSIIPAHIKSLGTAGDSLRMDFYNLKEIPGNIAGDVGKDQLSCSVGAKPSPFNDNRTLRGDLDIDLDPATDTLTVTPDLTYVVKDTLDLCPGNCGTFSEQFATVSLSRWEATGISGDVPFTVRFDSGMSAFDVPLKGPPPREAPQPEKKPSAEICKAKPDAPVVVATKVPGKDRIVKLSEGDRVEVLSRATARRADGKVTTWLRVKMLDGPEPGTIGQVQETFVEKCTK